MPGTISKNTKVKTTHKNEAYLHTVQQLRARNFSRELPFLIVSAKLPEGQVYREYPDGRMELQQMAPGGPSFKFTVIKNLLPAEADKVRKEYGLY